MSKRVHNKPQRVRLNKQQRLHAKNRQKRRRWRSMRSQVSTIKFLRVGGFGFNSPRGVARRKRREQDESLGTPA